VRASPTTPSPTTSPRRCSRRCGTAKADADEIIEKQGLKQITDSGAIEALIDEVLAANAAMVAEFRAGKEKAFNALVGQAMKATKGKANPQQVNELRYCSRAASSSFFLRFSSAIRWAFCASVNGASTSRSVMPFGPSSR
jgi:hypothetical protein